MFLKIKTLRPKSSFRESRARAAIKVEHDLVRLSQVGSTFTLGSAVYRRAGPNNHIKTNGL